VLEGGCFCGAIRYETAGRPAHRTICHCSICRRTTGAPLVAWFTVPRDALRIVAGTPASFGSSAKGTRTFCPRCGTQLTFQYADAPDEIDVTTCSLDDPGRVPPEDHTHASARVAWLALGDGLPVHRGAREEP